MRLSSNSLIAAGSSPCDFAISWKVRPTFEQRQVSARAERVLARGDDRALDRRVGRNLLDDTGEFGDDAHVDDVHRAAWHVPGNEGDAVCVDVEFEIVGHRGPSPQVRFGYGSPDFFK